MSRRTKFKFKRVCNKYGAVGCFIAMLFTAPVLFIVVDYLSK